LHDIDTLCGETGAARIGVVGFSMGAHWAVWLSQQRENRVAAVVLYYGARGGDFSGSRAAYLAHFAETDPWVSASSRKGMERAIERAGRPYRAIDHPGTSHWFAETDRRDAYVPKAAERAFAESAAHLARVLG
jgi:carboxymethylenebutenolidase